MNATRSHLFKRHRMLLLLPGLLFTSMSAPAQQVAPPGQELTPAQQKAADLRIPPLDRTALLPEMRTPTEVPSGERNPFGTVSLPPPEEEKETPVEVETEEMKIRRALGNMRVVGLSGGPGSYAVQMSSMILRTGDTVPQLFADQAEVLRVQSITDHRIDFVFEEKSKDLPPRTLGVNFDLRPVVHSLLAGDLFRKLITFDKKGAVNLKPLETPAVEALAKTLDKQGLESMVERRRDLMGKASPNSSKDEPTPAP